MKKEIIGVNKTLLQLREPLFMDKAIIGVNTILLQVPLFITIYSMVQLIFTYKIKYLYFSISIYVNDLLNLIMNKIFSYILPESITMRPFNAGVILTDNNIYDIGTSVLPQILPLIPNNKFMIHPTLGFPSGHSQFMMLFAIFMSLYLYNDDSDITTNLPKYIFIWLLAFGVLWQQWFSSSHTILQILVGGLIGIGFGIMYFKIYTLYFK